MRTLISDFLQQKSTSDRQPFYDYVASEANKMSTEEYEDFKVQVFNVIQNVKSKSRRHALPKRSATITTESKRVRILPPRSQQSTSSQTSAATGSSYSVCYTPSHMAFGNPISVNLQVSDEGSRHNLSGILSQLPDLSSQFINQQKQPQQPQQQLFIRPAPPQQQQPPQ